MARESGTIFNNREYDLKLCPRTGPGRTLLPLWLGMKPSKWQSWHCENKNLDTTTVLLLSPLAQERELVTERASTFLPFFLFSLFFTLSVSSSKFRTAVFGWCCLGYMPESQLHRSLGNQASDISLICNGTARAPRKLMRWEIPKQREELQMLRNKRMAKTVTTATFPSRGRTGLQN